MVEPPRNDSRVLLGALKLLDLLLRRREFLSDLVAIMVSNLAQRVGQRRGRVLALGRGHALVKPTRPRIASFLALGVARIARRAASPAGLVAS
jgi:hypothetical protein